MIIIDMKFPAKALAKGVKENYKALEKATKDSMRENAVGLKKQLRRQTQFSGLGARLAKTWRHAVYPKAGDSIDAAATVWTKAPHIIESYDKGRTLFGKGGNWLAIPTDNVPRGRRGKRITPDNWPASRFGPLQYIKTRAGKHLLIAQNVRARRRKGVINGVTPASQTARRTGKGLASAVMFILVPAVRKHKRLNVKAAYRKWNSRVPQTIIRKRRQALRSRPEFKQFRN